MLDVVRALGDEGIDAWLDGGWGVDALVGEQTRPHEDLDLAVDRDRLADVQRALGQLGFTIDPGVEPGLPARLVLADDDRVVDLHPLVFDETGNGWQQLDASGRRWGRYPADDLDARGVVAGQVVRCLSPALQLRFHLGYEWTERDRHDVRLLQDRFQVGPRLPNLEV